MRVSIVVPIYSMERYTDFQECIRALLAQTYDEIEVVVIVDGNNEVFDRAFEEFGDIENVVIFGNDEDAGPISRANMGAVQATGELLVLTDDDAVPENDWVTELVAAYQRHDAKAVGGRIEPEWVAGKAEYIPEEFYFLIGATHKGFPEEERIVRNTFGANLAFDREMYLHLGGVKLGGIDPSQVQGRETEFCARMQRTYGTGVIYTPDAVVRHKIYEYRTRLVWLLKRAFWQGYSKRAMKKLVPNSGGEESAFLWQLVSEYIPKRLLGLVINPSSVQTKQLLTLVALLISTGIGYIYGIARWR